MKKILKNEKGITMIALVITVIILLIVANILIYNAKDTLYIKELTNLYNDIDVLKDKVSDYYDTYGSLPASIEYSNTEQLNSILSTTNDTGNFYVIDLESMNGISLNYGKDYENIKDNETNANNYTDVYIINKNSHNIFYVKGVTVKDKDVITTYYTNYTEPDNVTIDLRYIDGILIPNGYFYIGKADNNGNEAIVISQNKDENVNTTSQTQYIWEKKISYTETVPENLDVSSDEEEEFLKSVNYYKGYFKNKNKIIINEEDKIDIVYIGLKENKWSEIYTKNEEFVDKNGDTAYIPKGFRVSMEEGTNEIRSGLVITDQIDSNNNSIGNEFVWVPVNDFQEFTREDFGENNISENDFITTQPTQQKYYEIQGDGITVNNESGASIVEAQNMYKSVRKYKGFYIGRYETGIEENVARTSSSDISQTPIVKKNKFIYNYIKWGNDMNDEDGGAVEKARAMYNSENYNGIKSTLCYGVQWDEIMRWIQKDSSINYILADSQEKGNYDQSGDLIKTGNYANYEIKNIFDLAGNVSEWTMETYDTNQKVLRGGKSGSTQNISNREAIDINSNDSKSGLFGFRIALYIQG